MGEIAIPSTPLVMRSSMILFCSAAVPSDVILKSAETSFNSEAAFSTPRRAIVQKSAELFVTNARRSFFVSFDAGVELHAATTSNRADRINDANLFIQHS